MLNNFASPVVQLVPIATAFVGFNLAIITVVLESAGVGDQYATYSIWLKAIPLEFFSLTVIAITLISIFHTFNPGKSPTGGPKVHASTGMKSMAMDTAEPVIKPRIVNIVIPMLTLTALSIIFFWLLGFEASKNPSFFSSIMNTEPNRAMLVALAITLFMTTIFHALQGYGAKDMASDMISGGNEIMPTLAILTIAWSLAAVSQKLGLSALIQTHVSTSIPAWSVGVAIFVISATVTYFIGSSWGAASLIMP